MAKETKYAVVARYAYSNYQTDEIISVHQTYDLAAKVVKGNSFVGIYEVESGAKKGDNYDTVKAS